MGKKILSVVLGLAIVISGLAVASVAVPSIATATNGVADYFVYSQLDTGQFGSYGVDGYVLSDGVDRIIFYSGSTAYIYTVTIPEGADPNMHPDNPEAPGSIAPRTFTFDKQFALGVSPGHECEFYVDEENNIIYLGASVGIRKYVYDVGIDNYTYDSQVAPPSPREEPYGTQTLAYDPGNDYWYAGAIAWNYNPGVTLRKMWKYDGSQVNSGSWVLAFEYTTPEGTDPMTHHDGLEFINGYLWLADYVGDYIKQYTTDGTLIDVFLHAPLGHELEGMGFSALRHFWCGSHVTTITEFGGGPLQAAVEGIPDQCIFIGEAFVTFDLDDYAVGVPPFTWSWSGNVELAVSIDVENVCTVTYPDSWSGSETITFTVTDSIGQSASDDATFTVCPVPVVDGIPDQKGPFEPFDLDNYLSGIDPADVTWSASDPGGGWTVDIDADNVVTVTAPEGATEPVTIIFTATTVCCGREASDSDDATFTPNLPPTADPNGPYLGAAGSPIVFDGTGSSDPDGDPLTYDWDWGDGNTSPDAGATPSHTYAGANIYDVCLTVSDGDLSDTKCTWVVVYDPTAGFVTGGGWIDSPAGAYTPDPLLAGKANFGFVSKYKKGADAPTGQTEFQFHVADLNFHSSSYDWLVVTGSDYARFKGSGTINGIGDYKFMLWAGDGDPDTFRIKIWEEDDGGDETVVYDNGFDQAIAGGSIVIHAK